MKASVPAVDASLVVHHHEVLGRVRLPQVREPPTRRLRARGHELQLDQGRWRSSQRRQWTQKPHRAS